MVADGSQPPEGISDVARMMEELGLKEEDLDDVIFDEKDVPQAAARWIALARVNSDKPYSQFWFFKNMRAAWELSQEVQFKPRQSVHSPVLMFGRLGESNT